jgi:hypothetical protein
LKNLKREFKDLQVKYKQREEEVKELKKHSKITKFNEISIENRTLLEEVQRLREMNSTSSSSGGKEQILIENNKKLQKEINGLHDDLRVKEDELSKCKKKLVDKQNEVNSLKNVLDTSQRLTTNIKEAERKSDEDVQHLLDQYREDIKICNYTIK